MLLQVTTSIEQQATESSLCERNTTAGLSTQGKNSWSSAINIEEDCLQVAMLMRLFFPIFSLGGQCITDGV